MVYDPLNFNWDEIFKELKKKLKRDPKPWEVQEELMRRFWDSIDQIEREK